MSLIVTVALRRGSVGKAPANLMSPLPLLIPVNWIRTFSVCSNVRSFRIDTGIVTLVDLAEIVAVRSKPCSPNRPSHRPRSRQYRVGHYRVDRTGGRTKACCLQEQGELTIVW